MRSIADEGIRTCIETRRSFVLDAGAGSGKTWSLVEALRYLRDTRGSDLCRQGQHIACITYTNIAKDEIVERTADNPIIRVSTIHEFLWSILHSHQKALKQALQKYNDSLEPRSYRKRDADALTNALLKHSVVYSYTGSEFLEGRIHHDDLLSIARIVFTDNPLLSRLVAARYPYIFVDEYQDASRSVVEILLGHILSGNSDNITIGLFGDKLQNIYHSGEHKGIGELPSDFLSNLDSIIKGENHRCSIAVIGLLNKIRCDIVQFPAGNNLAGSCVYINLTGVNAQCALDQGRKFLQEELGWSLDIEKTKELFLTHKLIAKNGGYERLLDIFDQRSSYHREQFLNGDDRRISYFLERVEPLAEAWSASNIGKTLSLLRVHGYKLNSNEDKKILKEALDKLLILRKQSSVRAVLEHIRDCGLLPLLDEFRDRLKCASGIPIMTLAESDDDAKTREEKDRIFYNGIFELEYEQIISYSNFFNDHTPFTTKHGVKGAEFDTVFVVLDDRGAHWNIYSFDKYLSGEDESSKPDRFRRTRNMFYVCCSRARRNLAVIDLSPPSSIKDARVKALFGSEQCYWPTVP